MTEPMMDDHQFDLFVARAVRELNEKQGILQAEYRLGDFARWWFDQDTSTIQFFDRMDRLGLEADFIDIGSLSLKSHTWKWAWGNNSVLPGVRQRARELKDLRSITGMEIFGRDQPFEIDDGQGLGTSGDLGDAPISHGLLQSADGRWATFHIFGAHEYSNGELVHCVRVYGPPPTRAGRRASFYGETRPFWRAARSVSFCVEPTRRIMWRC